MIKLQVEKLNNQDGSVLLATVVLMLLLTVIGIFAINQTVTEINITGNLREHKWNFYAAEGAALEASQRLENLNPVFINSILSPFWLNSNTADISDPGSWITGTNAEDSAIDDGSQTIRYSVRYEGIAIGSSLSMTNPTSLNTFTVYGAGTRNNGMSLVELGYYRKY